MALSPLLMAFLLPRTIAAQVERMERPERSVNRRTAEVSAPMALSVGSA
jgi:hypothetical protein